MATLDMIRRAVGIDFSAAGLLGKARTVLF
jgi:hypothetical protein